MDMDVDLESSARMRRAALRDQGHGFREAKRSMDKLDKASNVSVGEAFAAD